ncbi:MAG: hypothetical protein AAGC55_32645, partial [Myxococcota bacterium]
MMKTKNDLSTTTTTTARTARSGLLIGLCAAALGAGCMADLDVTELDGDGDNTEVVGESIDPHSSELQDLLDAQSPAEVYAADEFLASDRRAAEAGFLCGSTNLARSGSTGASSTFCWGSGLHCYSSSRINDGSRNTTVGGYYSWANGNTTLPQWVKVNFGSNRTFNRFELYTSAGYPIRD